MSKAWAAFFAISCFITTALAQGGTAPPTNAATKLNFPPTLGGATLETSTNHGNAVSYRYLVGKIQIDNLYIAQSERDGALSAYINALRGYWLAYYRLRRLTLYDFAAGQPIR